LQQAGQEKEKQPFSHPSVNSGKNQDAALRQAQDSGEHRRTKPVEAQIAQITATLHY